MKRVVLTAEQIEQARSRGLATPDLPGTYIRLPDRRYVHEETGTIVSRRRLENALRGLNFEQRVKLREQLGLPKGPGRGRKGVPRSLTFSPTTVRVYHPRGDVTVTVVSTSSQFAQSGSWWMERGADMTVSGFTMTNRVASGPNVVQGQHSYQIRISYLDPQTKELRYLQTVQAATPQLAWQLAEELLTQYDIDNDDVPITIEFMEIVIAD